MAQDKQPRRGPQSGLRQSAGRNRRRPRPAELRGGAPRGTRAVAAAVRLCAWPHRPDAHQRARFPPSPSPRCRWWMSCSAASADDPHEVLFKSALMRLALSRRAHDNFTGGNARIKPRRAGRRLLRARLRPRSRHPGRRGPGLPPHPRHPRACQCQPCSDRGAHHRQPSARPDLRGVPVRMKETALDPDFAFRG